MGRGSHFLCGIVEGYYGRTWPHPVRLAYASYLADLGLNTALYCPKGDPYLRRRWQEDWPAEQRCELEQLAHTYREQSINWGVGLSPYGLYLDYSAARRENLRRRIESIQRLDAPLLAVLFDDMPGELDALAERQAEIVADIARWLPGARLLVCPTYYSFDPVLEKHFGTRPQDYWQQLGREMPQEVDLFWTGNEVCSEAIGCEDITAINELLGRSVILWDNYPVNDGAVRSQYLYTRPLSDRDADLRPLLSGHLCNPMNQALLSLPALAGLSALYGGEQSEAHVRSWLGEDCWRQLQIDGPALQAEGLEGLGETRRRELARTYAALSGDAAREISDWLNGKYQFDPACLTD